MEPLAKSKGENSKGETLSEHVKQCLIVARSIVPSLPLSEKEKQCLLNDLVLGLALHDVGKAATGFQKVMIGEEKRWKGLRHEILSASFASSVMGIDESIIFAILTHHKSIPNSELDEDSKALDFFSIPISDSSASRPSWKKMQSEWYENYGSFKESWWKICKLIDREDLAEVGSLTTPLKLDPVWLERNIGSEGQLRKKSYVERRYFSLLRGLLITCDHMASGHYLPKVERIFSPIERTNAVLLEKVGHPRAFQIFMSQIKSSVILRAPTGSGKTEAALMWARTNSERYSRLYYVLPNIASINAMYQRLRSIYGDEAVGLLHSRARAVIYRQIEESKDDLESKLDDQKNAKMISSLARAIWFPIRVCTPHQILRFSLRGRGWETMLAEFPKALFIFDEIHAYDPRLVGQTLATAKLARKWNAKCAFVSATMPDFLITLLKENVTEEQKSECEISDSELRFVSPDANQDKEILEKKRHILINENGNLLDFISKIVPDMERGLKVLVVCNTVRSSQKVFQKLRELLEKKYGCKDIDDGIIMLIHSRFTRRDRTEKEDKIINEKTQPKILVATQVVEVSLDISYDAAYLEPAPIDATIQRMGRVNRRGKNEPALIHLMSEEISTHSVYTNRARVKKSTEELFELALKAHPLSEMNLVEAANRVYENGFDHDERRSFDGGFNNSDIANFEGELLAGASEDWKDKVLSDSPGVDVLPEELLNEFNSLIAKKLFIEAYNLLVPIQYQSTFQYQVDKTPDPWVVYGSYSPLTGLSVKDNDVTSDDLSDTLPSTPSNII